MNWERVIHLKEKKDITIIEIKEEDGLEIESFLDIDNSKNNFIPKDYMDNNIYIIHFPNGQKMNCRLQWRNFKFLLY